MTAVAKLPNLSADLLALIGSYGLARTDGVSEVERVHRWQQLIEGIKQYAADCVAALPHAELGGVENPDRYALRMLVAAGWVSESKANEALNIAHGFAKEPLSTPRAAEAVTEEMVDSVRADIMQAAANDGRLHIFLKDEWVRAALTAALTPPSAELPQKPGPTGHIPWSKEVG